MKLLSFTHKGRESYGAVSGDAVVDLGARLKATAPTLVDFLTSDHYAQRDKLVAGAAADLALSDIRYLPVIPRPEQIWCAITNYVAHVKEVDAAGLKREIPNFPPLFLRVWRSQIGHNEPIIRPKISETLDWEGELAVIIGTGGRHIAQADALAHVAGYSIYNDASIREWQFHTRHITNGKNFAGTGPFGPWMVTADEIRDPGALQLTTRLNGEVMQSTSTGDMIFGVPRLIEYISTIVELTPGDVIVTGTPGGVGWSRKPPIWMKPGDVVEVEIGSIGTLRNTIEDEV